MIFALALTLVVILAVANVSFGLRPAFGRGQLSTAKSRIFDPLFMSDEEEDFVKPGENPAEAKLRFEMNKRVRLGRSRDQDGKSNIWSIEPTMEVEEGEDEEQDQTKKNLFIAGGVIGTAIACLPLFKAFSKLFPDPADF
jgi:hypothetical protein